MEYEDLSNIDDKENSNSSIRDFLVVLALTFHAVLEGVAIGLEAHVNDVWLIFAGMYLDTICLLLKLNHTIKNPIEPNSFLYLLYTNFSCGLSQICNLILFWIGIIYCQNQIGHLCGLYIYFLNYVPSWYWYRFGSY